MTDAIPLVTKASHELSMERRQKIVNSSSINKKYKRLASWDTPVTKFLFGDDLKTSLTAIEATNKLEYSMGFSQKGPGTKYTYTAHKFSAKTGQDRFQRGRGRGWIRGRGHTAYTGYRGRASARTPRQWPQKPDRA